MAEREQAQSKTGEADSLPEAQREQQDISHKMVNEIPALAGKRRSETVSKWLSAPWWAVIIGAVMTLMVIKIFTDPDYELARKNIFPGVWITVRSTIIAFVLALTLGLIFGLGQISRNVVLRNISVAYVEIIRGIPILPMIFTLAAVIIPDVSKAVGQPNSVPNDLRAIGALALVYSAYIAEIIRGGVQSIPRGQTEAGRSLGLSEAETMKSVVLPQAVRAILPPIANDFIAILKDTSLLSVLGVAEVTRRARQYSASSFKFAESFFTMTFVYLVLVLSLSMLLTAFERYMTRDKVGER